MDTAHNPAGPDPLQGVPVGISMCLLGERVRFDGGSKDAPDLIAALEPPLRFVGICPEVGAGLGTPREPMTLVGNQEAPSLWTHSGSRDCTDNLRRYTLEAIEDLRREGICGFIFKARSPSCGLGDTALYDQLMKENPEPLTTTDGLFARDIKRAFPGLPVASEDQLANAEQRQAFVLRVLEFAEDHSA